MKNQNELFHSDIYLGEEFSEGLYHFKYIDKVFKNGKWKYIYDAAAKAGTRAQRAMNSAKDYYNTKITGNTYKKAISTNNANARKFKKDLNNLRKEYEQGNISKGSYTNAKNYYDSKNAATADMNRRAKQLYNQSLAGKAESAFNAAKRKASEASKAANKKFNEQAKKAKNTYKKTKRKANATLKKYRAAGKNFINNLIKRK